MAAHSIHTDPDVQHIDVRLYFDNGLDREYLLDRVSRGLQSPPMADMVSAYQLVPATIGSAILVPDSKPLA